MMSKMIVCAWAAAAALAGMGGAARADDLVAVLKANPNTQTVYNAIVAAGLETTLAGSGPFTIFAPADSAFSTAPMADYKLKYLEANKERLTSLLEYHVTSGSVTAADLTNGEQIKTLEGQDLSVDINATTGLHIDDVTCGRATVLKADIAADNGYVHIIDTVFVPFGVFCPDTVFAAEQRGDGRISAYGYDCRRKGFKHLATEKATKPVGLSVDSTARMVFWSNDQDYPHGSPTSWASALNFNGTDKHHFLNNIIDPQGLDADTVSKKVYFTQHSGYSISRSNYDGSDIERLVYKANNQTFQPSDVAVDAKAGLMFASIEGPEETQVGYIAMFKIDGSDEQILAGPGISRPYGLCVDEVHQHVFYIVGGHGGEIRCVEYGSIPCKAAVVESILEYPYMCAVDNSFTPYGGPTTVLFTQANKPGQIFYAPADGKTKSQVRVLSSDDLIAPMGVAFGCVGKTPW